MPRYRWVHQDVLNHGEVPDIFPVLRVFAVAEWGNAAGKLPFLRFQQVGRMDSLGNILAVHLVQDIFERGNVVVLPHGVNTVIHGDIAHAVSWEEIFNELPRLQVVPPQTGKVFRNDKVYQPALNGF